MSNELKPCPFCGGKAKKIFIGNEFTKKLSIEIKCTVCRVKRVDAALHHDHDWLDDIGTKHWNERHSIDHEQEQRDKLERHNEKVRDNNHYQAGYLGLPLGSDLNEDQATEYHQGAKDRQRERDD